MFEPFFTTKPEGRGSGLGLATVTEIVRGWQGRIDVESEIGRGTVFLVWIPADSSGEPVPEHPTAATDTSRSADAPPARTCNIMVVEDQALVRRGLVRLLGAAGHRVTTAEDGASAVAMFEHASPRPDVVLLDLDLPVMSGDGVIVHLLAVDPSVKVIVMSGHWDPDRREALLRAGAAWFLAKPFDAAGLRSSIARVLSGESR